MANTPEDFVRKFHSLEGTTVAQRRKSFFVLLHQSSSLMTNTQVLDTLTANLVPKTYLESLFRLEFLIYYRRVQELQQLLKEGNDVFVSKIAKQFWFFKAAFNEVGADQLVNEILPCMSYCVRKKVLRKLSKCLNSEQFDKIFDIVVARYGIFLASQYITGCSAAKIRQILLEYPVKLTTVQLKVLYKKDINLIEYYFENTNNSINNNAYKHFIRFLYCENKALFKSLQEKYRFKMLLGHRLTKKFVAFQKDAVIQDPLQFDYLKMKTVIRTLGKSSINLFRNCLPPTMYTFRIPNILSKFPEKYHYNLCIKVVENHYNIKYAENPDLIDEFLLKLISDNAERAALAKIKVDLGYDNYIKYLTTQDSIPLIKERINLTSDIYERGKLVKYLIETCHINNNLEALTQVMKYFCFRHKNDEINVHMQFIHKIENLFGFKNFTEEMWNYFNELLTIHMLKYDDDFSTYQKIQTLPLIKFNKGTSNYQKLSYLYFLFGKNEPILDELLLEYLDTSSEFPRWGKYSKEFEKYFLLFVMDVNSRKELKKEQMENNCGLLGHLNSWNRYYKDDQISFYDFPFLVQSFDYVVRNCKYVNNDVQSALKNKIFTTTSNSYRDTYLQVYWDRLNVFFSKKDFDWFMKYDPLVLVNNFHQFIDKIIGDSPLLQLKIWYKVKKYSHLQLDEKSVQFCLSKINDETSLDVKPKFVICLSVVMKPSDFVVVADSYKPANKTLNLKDQAEVRLYNLQCSIGQHFKNTKSYEVLSSLLNYCAGDYFKYSLRSLYSILYRTPENMLPQYLNHLAKKAVSVRKHALYLTCELSTVTEVEDILTLLSKTEGVQSLQKQMFTATIQYFVKNPADNFFEMVKSNMLNISKNDDESLKCIVESTSAVPVKYRCAYIQYSWEYLEKIVDVWLKLLPLKQGLLREMNIEIKKQLPLEFAMGILKQHFLVDEKCLNFNGMSSFGFSFLSCREEKTVILETILNLVDLRSKGQVAFLFFYDWQKKVMSSKEENLEYLEPFINYFESKINILDNFKDYMKIFFLKAKIFSKGDLCTKIFTFYENLVSTYGPHVVHLFSSELYTIAHFTNQTVTKYYYYHKLMEEHPVPIVAILIIYVMSIPPARDKSDTALFYQTLKLIEKIPDLGVQFNLRNKFSECLSKLKKMCDGSQGMEVGSMYSDSE